MAKRSSEGPVIQLLLAIIVFLLAIFYFLFQPSAPTSSTSSGSRNVAIPLTNGSFSRPGDIQGPNGNLSPQSAMTVKPDQLKNLSF